MKFRILLTSVVVSALVLLSSYTWYYTDEDGRGELLLQLMIQGMEYYHYQPLPLDDKLSEMVFDDYLEQLDYNKRFFTQQDIQSLSKYRHLIDDELQNKTFDMFNAAQALLTRRTDEAQGYVEAILAQPFDFNIQEELNTDTEDLRFATSEAEIRERWRQSLKYQVLTRLVSKLERQEKAAEAGDVEIEVKTFEQLEAEARAQVQETYKDYFHRLDRRDNSERRADYLNIIAAIYDPHTGYFPPKDKEDFDITMSGRLEGIGAQLQEDNGFVKVVSIVPGSASARQGQLQVNDVILKVAQGAEEPVEVIDMDIDDAVKLIRGPKGTEVRLTVRKIDGVELVIPIIRDIVELEETYAKSAILYDEASAERIGYIYLPKFYADFYNSDGRRCATDVAREIVKLKAEGIEGLILDLRDNGGGSLQDVVDMAGLFVDNGPIVQVKSREGAPRILSDREAGVLYDGPLVVMVNSFSASASEIMAAAMQDYDRGVIVGSASTFGKGTVQRFVNFDDLIRGNDVVKPLGEMKLTTQKFYRINGGATQLRGVASDIVLPDEYSLLEIGEKDQEHTMPWDEITPARYKRWEQGVSGQLDRLRNNSARRVADNQAFAAAAKNAQRLKTRQDRETYSLHLPTYRAEKQQLDEEAARYKEQRQDIPGFAVNNLSADVARIESDNVRQQRNNTWIQNLRKDAYVFEAMKIVEDIR
ncbi:MAG: carboxy terminal-processing peptidase [Bacteroidia bacterium]